MTLNRHGMTTVKFVGS